VRQGRLFPSVFGALVVALATCAAVACGSTSVSQVTGPSDARCQTSLTSTPQSVGPDGGSVTVSVSTTRDCAWTSTSEASWIRLSTATGQGEATFTANVEANPQTTSRSGNVAVNGQRTSISQAGRPCTFDLASAGAQFNAGGGTGRINVTTLTGCTWRPTTTAAWIQIPSNAITGSGGVNFQVSANNGDARAAVVTVADKQFVVTQSSAAEPGSGPEPTSPPVPNCVATVTPLTIDTSAATSVQTIQIAIGPTCAWSAASGAAWLTITSPVTATGSASLTVNVGANAGPSREGTLTIAGQTVTVRQTAVACSFTLNPTSQNFSAGAGAGRFTVTAPAGCSWSASKSVPWIDVGQGTGTGTGDVTFSVQANTATSVRAGTITVGGQTFAVSQAGAACAYALAPATLAVPANSGSHQVTVTTSPTCSWTAAPGAGWIEISNLSGTGSGDINFTVQANTGATQRTTTITVGGQSTTVTQSGVACTYAINPASANIVAAGSSSKFTVTTQGACGWTAASGAAWVVVNMPPNGTGSGTGDVTYTVQANPDQTQRTTTITVAGQTHTVTQAAATPPCTYALDPASGSSPAAGGGGMFTVTTQAGCAWTATTGDAWITVATASGTGTGEVSYTVQANGTGLSRSGTITAGGKSYSLTQAP
jgi:hypothetical protein